MKNEGDRRTSTELLKTPYEIGIFDENDPLRKAVVWGPVGAEAELATLLPYRLSKFFGDMDVRKARSEAAGFQQLLEEYGVDVIVGRDILAQTYPANGFNRDQVLDALIDKSRRIREKYNTTSPGTEEAIAELFELDIARYGVDIATQLNYELSLAHPLPLGNSIYARDQMNVIGNRRVRSNMTYRIRRPEVALYERIYNQLGVNNPIELPQGSRFEGGDAYIHRGIVYVGVGDRTNKEAALHIYGEMHQTLAEQGLRFALVEDPQVKERSDEDKMNFMHIDTFSAAVDYDTIAICEKGARPRVVSFVEMDKTNKPVAKSTGQSFIEHLEAEGNKLLYIPEEEQLNFGANLLTINDKTAFVPFDDNSKIITQLKSIGKDIKNAHLDESTKGYGAAHCMTGQLLRAK